MKKLLDKKDVRDIADLDYLEVESATPGKDEGIAEKYKSELYGVLVSLTNGDAKTLVKSAQDTLAPSG